MQLHAILAGTAAGLAINAVLAPFYVRALAVADFFFTDCPEGRGKVILAGESFHHAILSLKGYHLNAKGQPGYDPSRPEWEILPNLPDFRYERRSWALREAGAYWIGIPFLRNIYSYYFKWREHNQEQPGTPETAGALEDYVQRNEETSFFYANSFPYVFVADQNKTSDLMPVKMIYTVRLRITNPHKALFGQDAWLAQIESDTLEIVRDYVGIHTYAQLTSEEDGTRPSERSRENFEAKILELNTVAVSTYGVTVESVNIERISMTGPAAEENEKTSIQRYNAERKGEATVVLAEAEAKAIRARGEADADVIRLKTTAEAEGSKKLLETYAEQPELAKTMLHADAMKSPGDGKVIVLDAARMFSDIADTLTRK